jgi:hypothetical protein
MSQAPSLQIRSNSQSGAVDHSLSFSHIIHAPVDTHCISFVNHVGKSSSASSLTPRRTGCPNIDNLM